MTTTIKPVWLKKLHVAAHYGYPQTGCPMCRMQCYSESPSYPGLHCVINHAADDSSLFTHYAKGFTWNDDEWVSADDYATERAERRPAGMRED
jgi:hypothetical protein